MTFWRSFVAWLAAMSADPAEIDRVPARSYAAVSAAYATFAPVDAVPAPPGPPAPEECGCGGKCVGGRFRPDGVIWQDCRPGCKSCGKRAEAEPQRCRCEGPCSPACSCGCASVLAPLAPKQPPCPTGTCPPARGGG